MIREKLTLEEMLKETKPGTTHEEFHAELIDRIQRIEATPMNNGWKVAVVLLFTTVLSLLIGFVHHLLALH